MCRFQSRHRAPWRSRAATGRGSQRDGQQYLDGSTQVVSAACNAPSQPIEGRSVPQLQILCSTSPDNNKIPIFSWVVISPGLQGFSGDFTIDRGGKSGNFSGSSGLSVAYVSVADPAIPNDPGANGIIGPELSTLVVHVHMADGTDLNGQANCAGTPPTPTPTSTATSSPTATATLAVTDTPTPTPPTYQHADAHAPPTSTPTPAPPTSTPTPAPTSTPTPAPPTSTPTPAPPTSTPTPHQPTRRRQLRPARRRQNRLTRRRRCRLTGYGRHGADRHTGSADERPLRPARQSPSIRLTRSRAEHRRLRGRRPAGGLQYSAANAVTTAANLHPATTHTNDSSNVDPDPAADGDALADPHSVAEPISDAPTGHRDHQDG